MQKQDDPQEAYGVFKPVGHVVISFPPDTDLDEAQRAIVQAGVADADVRRYSAEEMKRHTAHDIDNAAPLASLGQELNLVKAHRELAEQGYQWLVVRVDNTKQGQRIADVAKGYQAERAQHYGRFIIEELIEHEGEMPQVAESPARGLDSGTVSGREKDR